MIFMIAKINANCRNGLFFDDSNNKYIDEPVIQELSFISFMISGMYLFEYRALAPFH